MITRQITCARHTVDQLRQIIVHRLPAHHASRGASEQVHGQTLMPGAANNGWEHRARCIIPGKSRLDHSRPIVTHKGGHFSIISHLSLQNDGVLHEVSLIREMRGSAGTLQSHE